MKALSGIEVFADPNVLVGYEKADDAGVYRLDDQTALVQSVDFFTPVVDDPYVYGQIAAANSLSDIYAMGGVPRFALSVLGFPKDNGAEEILHSILKGGTDKMNEARVAVIGGHSVQDPEIKFGYCVTGIVSPQRIYTNSGARPGDTLILTKPLGTGIITTGIKFNKATPEVAAEAIKWMLVLNAAAGELLNKFTVHSVTDITGYGLLGHAYEMANGSDVTMVLESAKLPVLEGAAELARHSMLPGGIETNRRYVGHSVRWNGTSEFQQQIVLDPQTSGGLLISMPSSQAEDLVGELEAAGYLGRSIGRVEPRREFLIEVNA